MGGESMIDKATVILEGVRDLPIEEGAGFKLQFQPRADGSIVVT
ncbi:hypothetical protein [Streptomyces sp. NPDC051572]